MNIRNNTVKYNLSNMFLNSLIKGVKPALGCTEPVAIGLATSKAYQEIKGVVEKVEVRVSPNIYKNGMGVGIPGTKEIGLIFAAALGITCGDPDLAFEVFKYVDDKSIKEAEKLVQNKLVNVLLEDTKGSFYIEANLQTSSGRATCIIKNTHTNIVYVEANGQVLLNNVIEEGTSTNANEYMKDINLGDIRDFVENVPYEDIEFLLEGVKLNMDIAKVGMEEKPGPGLGAAMNLMMLEGVMKRDVIGEARALTAAACDARMAGINMPVMSSAGSGNHGITAIIPPTVVCEHL